MKSIKQQEHDAWDAEAYLLALSQFGLVYPGAHEAWHAAHKAFLNSAPKHAIVLYQQLEHQSRCNQDALRQQFYDFMIINQMSEVI